MKPPSVAPKPISRTLGGLREGLFEIFDKLRAGTIDSREAKTAADVAGQIIDAARLQLEFEGAWTAKKIGEKLKDIPLVEHQP